MNDEDVGYRVQWLERLRHFKIRFDELLGMFDEATALRGDTKEEAQRRLKYLKDELRREVNSSGSVVTGPGYGDYYSPISQALAGIHIRWNSKPDTRWVDQLGGASQTIRLAIHRLENSLKASGSADQT